MSVGDASRALGISEDELKKLVEDGDILALKEGGELYFTKDVIDNYRDASGMNMLLADDDLSLLEDDVDQIDLLALDDDGELSLAGDDEAAEETAAVAPAGETDSVELSFDDELPEIDLSSDDLIVEEDTSAVGASAAGDDETLLNIDGLLEEDSEATTPVASSAEDFLSDDTMLDTDLGFAEDTDTFEMDSIDDLTADVSDQSALLRGGGARVMQMKRKESQALMTVLSALTAAVLLVPLAVVAYSIFFGSESVEGGYYAPWVEKVNVLGGFLRNLL